MKATPHLSNDLTRSWPLSYAARMGSSVRSKGIFLEVRAQLPTWAQKALSISSGELSLRMPRGADAEFSRAGMLVTRTLQGIEDLPVLPREIEDILSISTTERHRWLKDGRLPSLGTRTVRLAGRAKQITFHVFDPAKVADLLESSTLDEWREQDAEAAAENRRRAAWRAKLKRSSGDAEPVVERGVEHDDEERFKLRGWAEFEREGPK